VPIALGIGVGCLLFADVVAKRLLMVEHVSEFEFVLARDWPMIVAAAALLWILRRGVRDASSTAHDSPILLGRTASVVVISLGEMLSCVLGFFYEPTWPGHAVAAVGAALVVVATGALAWRRHWLDRVRAGRVSGWSIRAAVPGDRVHGLADFVTQPAPVGIPRALLVRHDPTPRAYRDGPRDEPVAFAYASSGWL
jgi:hypothetical protein